MNDSTLKSDNLLKSGEYRIERTLGQGGFGITYEAEQTSLGRKVAVKEFFMKEYCERDGGTSHVTMGTSGSRELVSKFKDKFIREAKMIAGLDHEHIVKIIDVFEENGTAYYVMEYLGGGSLDRKIKDKGAMPESVALDFIRQIASALDYLHSQNILHFDIKPANVLLGKNGSAKLIDFGISKHYDESGVQTSSTPVGISKGYAPLEQYQQGSDIKSFTPATDIYSLGATLYALLSGTNPPEASVIYEDGLPIITGVSPIVMRAVEKAMQPRRKDRPQSVAEFLKLLDSPVTVDDEETVVPDDSKPALAPKPKPEPQPSPMTNPAPKPVRKPFPKWLFGLFAGIVVAILAAVLINRPDSPFSTDSQQTDSTVVAEVVPEEPMASKTSASASKNDSPVKPSSSTISTHASHEWVDLDLSVKWATCNVGASSPEDYGSYFAWGETSPKSEYSWTSLKYRTEGDSYDNVKFSKYVASSQYGPVDNRTVLEMSDDAARANWGDSWRMPTISEFQELIEKCTWTWTTMNGKKGYKVVSKSNGNSIFIPAAGRRFRTSHYGLIDDGDYWSSSLYGSNSWSARSLSFSSRNYGTSYNHRFYGIPVRPVFP